MDYYEVFNWYSILVLFILPTNIDEDTLDVSSVLWQIAGANIFYDMNTKYTCKGYWALSSS